MPAFLLAPLLNGLRILLMAKLGAMVARVLTFLGVTFATQNYAVEPAIDQVRHYMTTNPGGDLGAQVVAWAGVMKLDVAVTMLLSAYSAVWTIKQAKAFLMKAN